MEATAASNSSKRHGETATDKSLRSGMDGEEPSFASEPMSGRSEGAENSGELNPGVNQPVNPIPTPSERPEPIHPVLSSCDLPQKSQEEILNRAIWGWRDQADGFYE
jgi:hypothetical protein